MVKQPELYAHLGTQTANTTGQGRQPPLGGHTLDQWRKSITTLTFVVFSLVSAAVFAQVPKTPIAIKPDAPDRYTVVKGDTLWGIASRYTDSPWRWNDLWEANKDTIKNPHRIYPGDVIVLDRSRAQLALEGGGTVRLSPRVRAEATAGAAIPVIPTNIIEPFLTRPLVVEPDGLANAPTIVSTEESRVILEAGNRAYVKGIGESKEPNWYVYRWGAPLVDPDTNTTLGYEAIYLGTARVTRAGQPAVIQLTSVTQEVGVGDKLVPHRQVRSADLRAARPQYADPGPRHLAVRQESARRGDRSANGDLDQPRQVAGGGSRPCAGALPARRKGRRCGPPTARRRDAAAPQLTLPNERYGLAFVFRVFDRVSYALVMTVSRPVSPQDVVQNP